MEQKKVYIVDYTRTPLGAPGKSLERFMSSDLAAKTIKAVLERNGLDPLKVGQVVYGQAHPSTMPNNIGHYAWLKAELPVDVPGYTVQANSSSALQAVRNAYYLVATGNEQIVVAGGADSYSAAPFVLRDARLHFYPQHRVLIDSLEEAECCTQPEAISRQAQYELAHGAELSEEAKAFAADSKKKAAAYEAACGAETVPMSYVDRKKGEIVISKDEVLAALAAESPLAPYADNAISTLIVSEEALKNEGLTAKAEILGIAVAGCDPKKQESAGAMAAKKLLSRKGVAVSDVACFEILENSAEDVFENAAALGVGLEKVNPLGGALAFGKNDGAEGLLMLQRLTGALKSGELGVVVSYTAGGMGMAALIRRV